MIDPTHNSLLADYYPIEVRNKVYSTHRAANAVGGFVGPLMAGLLAYAFGWRVPFLVFVIPTIVIAVLALRLHEPVRGRWERKATGAHADVVETEELAPSFAESWRIAHKVPTLRRIWWSLPFVAVALIGFVVLGSLFYDEEFGLDERARGVAAAIAEPFQLVGLVYGARIATRRFGRDVAGLMRFVSQICLLSAGVLVAFALSPNIVVAVALNCVVNVMLAIARPGHPRHAVARHPGPGAGHRVLDRLAVGHPRPADPAADRVDRRHLDDPHRDARDGAAVLHRQRHRRQRVRHDRRRHRPGVDARWPRAARRCCTAARAMPSCSSSAVSTPATATGRCCSASTWTSARARSSPCSAPTAPARARC